MRNYLVLAAIAAALSACTLPVVATFDDEDTVYHGSATQVVGIGANGEIKISNSKDKVCTGTYHYLNSDISIRIISLVGVAAVRCNDGTSASMRFRSITKYSGWGTGKTNKGTKISFTYGMNEDEARMYLNLPEQSLDEASGLGNDDGGGSQSPAKQVDTKEIRELGLGSGFFISNQGHLLTNNHVVRGCEYMQIKLPDGSQQRGETLFTDSINDLAVVKVNYAPPVIATFPATPSYRVGDDVLVFGFGLGYELSSSGILTTGTIGALSGYGDDSRFMQITATMQHGNSGGPLSDRMGNVIGINTSGLDAVQYYNKHGISAEAANFSVKELVIKTFLKAHSLPFTEINKTQVMSTADIGEQMRLYSVKALCYGHPKKEKK